MGSKTPQKFIQSIQAQIDRLGLTVTPEVLEAFILAPREFFVRKKDQKKAYEDKPLYIESGQTISAPHMYAIMLSNELLDPFLNMKVLEIGTGSGYGAALLSKITPPQNITTIERHLPLVEFATSNLHNAGIENINIIHGDGTSFHHYDKFDRILITAAGHHLPDKIINSLKKNGRILMPIVNEDKEQWLYVITLDEDLKPAYEKIIRVAFVPLIYNED